MTAVRVTCATKVLSSALSYLLLPPHLPPVARRLSRPLSAPVCYLLALMGPVSHRIPSGGLHIPPFASLRSRGLTDIRTRRGRVKDCGNRLGFDGNCPALRDGRMANGRRHRRVQSLQPALFRERGLFGVKHLVLWGRGLCCGIKHLIFWERERGLCGIKHQTSHLLGEGCRLQHQAPSSPQLSVN